MTNEPGLLRDDYPDKVSGCVFIFPIQGLRGLRNGYVKEKVTSAKYIYCPASRKGRTGKRFAMLMQEIC
jgi:hypothetical protein